MEKIENKMLIFRLGEECYSAYISEIERILEYTEAVQIPDVSFCERCIFRVIKPEFDKFII